MNITEATKTVHLLRLLDGSHTGRDADQLLDAIVDLAARAEKPLQLKLNLALAETRSTLVHLLQRHADGLPAAGPEWDLAIPMADCPSCGGSGDIQTRRDEYGVWQTQPCGRCGGYGEVDARLVADDTEQAS